MEHVTEDLEGKRVVAPDGTELGKIAAVDDDKAIMKGQTGISADMEAALSGDGDDRLALDPNQIESVDDDSVRVVDDFDA